MGKILLVEDEPDMASQIKDWLAHDGHLVEVCEDGASALGHLRAFHYDLVILDRMLPALDGIEVCKRFRDGGGKTPVLMLTALDTVIDRAEGLNVGADDYLGKPFHFVELSARVRAAIRRGAVNTGKIYRAHDLLLDPEAHKVTKSGVPVHLEPKEFNLLEFFMRNPNRTFSTEALLDRVWNSDTDVSPDTVRTYIKVLRRKLDESGKPSILTTVHGLGYRLDIE